MFCAPTPKQIQASSVKATRVTAVQPPHTRYLDLLKGNFKRKRFVVVRVESAFLDGSLLLLESLVALVQRQFHVRVCSGGDRGVDGEWGGEGASRFESNILYPVRFHVKPTRVIAVF